MTMKLFSLRGWRLAAAGACVIALGAGVAAQKQQITGAGATFPYPIYSKWFSEYNKLHPDIEINYQSQGSGAGIRQITNQTVFFGATDGPMTDDQKLAAPGPILHFPTVLGAVVPIFNLPGVSAELKFTGPLLADIFLGKITRWNHADIAAANPGVALPSTAIAVVHRAEGSGTTYIWVDYLSKVSPEWKKRVGVANSVNWPVGLGGQGNEGVAGLVKQTPGALGYVELIYAAQNSISFGAVQNSSGTFVKASVAATTAAGASAAKPCGGGVKIDCMPADFRVSITNAAGPGAYPIASFTWLLFYESPKNKVHGKTMVDFLKWALTDGQKFAAELGYAPLPPAVVQLEMEALKKIKVQQ
jgi:phosphate transport system substrate-binding protein